MDSDYNVVKTWFGRTVIRSSYKLFYEVKYVRSIFMIGFAWWKRYVLYFFDSSYYLEEDKNKNRVSNGWIHFNINDVLRKYHWKFRLHKRINSLLDILQHLETASSVDIDVACMHLW